MSDARSAPSAEAKKEEKPLTAAEKREIMKKKVEEADRLALMKANLPADSLEPPKKEKKARTYSKSGTCIT